MTGISFQKNLRRIAIIALATTIAGCENTPLGDALRERAARSEVPAVVEPPADANGIVAYEGFRVMVAQDGDTIAEMASRVGLSELVLARYNGLPSNYLLRQGDRLALPDQAQVAAVEQGWTPEVVTGVLDDLPDSTPATAPATPPGNVPLRHRVEPGETLFSIAKLYGVSVTALASWNGISGDLKVDPGRSLIVPTSRTATSLSSEPPEIATEVENQPATSQPGTTTEVTQPPSSTQPLPENEEVVVAPEGPDLSTQRSQVSPGDKMLTPVQGEIVRPYNAAPGRNKNDGIDFGTAAGAVVKAAASGEVALVSPSIGLGQIILIRHRDNIISVYGRMSKDIRVKKGQMVRKGEVLGTVADGNPPTFHFEVRRGTEAVDPTPFL